MLIGRMRRASSVAVLLFAGAVAAASDSKPSVPNQIGGIPYKGAKKFDDPALGVALSYKSGDTTLNIFIYNGGVGDIPIGTDTVVALQQFEQAKGDVLGSKAWTTIRLVSDGAVLLGSKSNVKSYLALFEGAMGDSQYYSILYLTTGPNKFYKARLTTPKGNAILDPEPMAQLRRDLGDFFVSLILR